MGQKLSDLTTQKVIVGILAMLLIVPAFNIYSGLYGDYAGLTQGGLQILHDLYLDVRRLCFLADTRCAALHVLSAPCRPRVGPPLDNTAMLLNVPWQR